MKPPSPRAVRLSRWLVWPLAALVTLGVVGQASYAAFSARVSNSDNSLTAGTVTLTDDDSGSALFSLSDLEPSSSGSRCITVTSTGSLPSVVKLYATDAATTNSLANDISWTITQGTIVQGDGRRFGSCSGFNALPSGSSVYSGTLTDFTGSATTYASGLGSWSPTGNASDTRTFQFKYTLSSDTPDSAQDGTATFGLTWETQNS